MFIKLIDNYIYLYNEYNCTANYYKLMWLVDNYMGDINEKQFF